MKNKIGIKAQRGITYECYRGFTDNTKSRVRRGQRYSLLAEYTNFYAVVSVSGKGYAKMVRKEKFASHFIPLNPLDVLYVPFD